jgi:hypothetical protein
MKIIGCGPKSRLCVLVDRAAGTFGVVGNKDDVYMIVKGYCGSGGGLNVKKREL